MRNLLPCRITCFVFLLAMLSAAEQCTAYASGTGSPKPQTLRRRTRVDHKTTIEKQEVVTILQITEDQQPDLRHGGSDFDDFEDDDDCWLDCDDDEFKSRKKSSSVQLHGTTTREKKMNQVKTLQTTEHQDNADFEDDDDCWLDCDDDEFNSRKESSSVQLRATIRSEEKNQVKTLHTAEHNDNADFEDDDDCWLDCDDDEFKSRKKSSSPPLHAARKKNQLFEEATEQEENGRTKDTK